MSTTTTPDLPPDVPLTPWSKPPVETAPSAMVREGPGLARLIGFGGLVLFVIGLVVVVATKAVGTPRLISEGMAYIIGALGLVLMLYHAAIDPEREIRRVYGGWAAFLLLVAVVISLVPGPFSANTGTVTKVGFYFLPWGMVAALAGLLFAVACSRHETEAFYEATTANTLLLFGALLSVGSVAAGVFQPDYLAGPGICLALLGAAFICGYFSQVDTSDGIGYTVAFTLGVVGALALVYAIARAVAPTVLFEGPSVLRRADQAYDRWRVLGRGIVIVALLTVAAAGAFGKQIPGWLRACLAALGLAGAGVFIAGSTGSYLNVQPRPFLVPGGVCLMSIGLVYLMISLGVCSDSQFITLARRELAGYFFSPIGILVLFGMALAQGLTYWLFVSGLMDGQSHPEPIVRGYGAGILNVFVFTFQIPILTMRLLAEEKRTGSLEVLLTAPLNEAVIVISKFTATLIFFMICWLPMGLFLIALNVEGTQPFDYRPMLGFYACLATQGAMFIAMGIFFSSVTKNQVVAAMFTFVPMISLLFFAILKFNPSQFPLPEALQNVAGRLSFYHMWLEALGGQLPIRDVLLNLSLAVFGLFITVKVLEVRKWS